MSCFCGKRGTPKGEPEGASKGGPEGVSKGEPEVKEAQAIDTGAATSSCKSLGKKIVEGKDDDRNRVHVAPGDEDKVLEQVHICLRDLGGILEIPYNIVQETDQRTCPLQSKEYSYFTQ